MRSLPDTYQMCEVTSLRACSVKVAPNRLEMDEAEEGSTEERSLSPPGSFKKMQSSLRESVATAASRLLHSNGLLHSKDQPQKKSMSVPESMTKKKRRSVIDLPNRLSFYSFEEKKRREAELEEQRLRVHASSGAGRWLVSQTRRPTCSSRKAPSHVPLVLQLRSPNASSTRSLDGASALSSF